MARPPPPTQVAHVLTGRKTCLGRGPVTGSSPHPGPFPCPGCFQSGRPAFGSETFSRCIVAALCCKVSVPRWAPSCDQLVFTEVCVYLLCTEPRLPALPLFPHFQNRNVKLHFLAHFLPLPLLCRFCSFFPACFCPYLVSADLTSGWEVREGSFSVASGDQFCHWPYRHLQGGPMSLASRG